MQPDDTPHNIRSTLAAWGATPDLVDAVPRLGRVTRVERGECDVMTASGPVRAISDSTRAQGDQAPVTGDWVALERLGDLGPAITEVLPRRSLLARRDPGEQGTTQGLVANIETVFVVHGLDRPLPPGRLERCLVIVWASGAEPVVVLSKADLADGATIRDLAAIVGAIAPNVPVVPISSLTGDGLDRLRTWLRPATTTALLGESGSGKSTLVNALLGHEAQATAEVRRGDSKGRHTTVTRDLLLLGSGALLVDTPGIRAVGLVGGDEVLATVFADIERRAEGCRFHDCAHGDEPGCSVLAAVESGDLDARRLERYRLMAAELADQEDRDDQRARRANRRSR